MSTWPLRFISPENIAGMGKYFYEATGYPERKVGQALGAGVGLRIVGRAGAAHQGRQPQRAPYRDRSESDGR